MAHAERNLEEAVTDMLRETTRQLDQALDHLAEDLAADKAWADANKPVNLDAIKDRADAVSAIAKLVFPRIGVGVDALTTRLAYGTQRLLSDLAGNQGTASR